MSDFQMQAGCVVLMHVMNKLFVQWLAVGLEQAVHPPRQPYPCGDLNCISNSFYWCAGYGMQLRSQAAIVRLCIVQSCHQQDCICCSAHVSVATHNCEDGMHILVCGAYKHPRVWFAELQYSCLTVSPAPLCTSSCVCWNRAEFGFAVG
jgi:hypothetical protein